MKIISLLALLAIGTSAAEMRACSKTNLNGSCKVRTTSYDTKGKTSGSFKSYNFKSSLNKCVKVCKGCTDLGWRCQTYGNNAINFDKFIIFDWQGGEGPGSTSCC